MVSEHLASSHSSGPETFQSNCFLNSSRDVVAGLACSIGATRIERFRSSLPAVGVASGTCTPATYSSGRIRPVSEQFLQLAKVALERFQCAFHWSYQSSFRAVSEQFQGSFQGAPTMTFPPRANIELAHSTGHIRAVSVQFQSSFRAVSEQFQISSRAVFEVTQPRHFHREQISISHIPLVISEQFQSNFPAVPDSIQCAFALLEPQFCHFQSSHIPSAKPVPFQCGSSAVPVRFQCIFARKISKCKSGSANAVDSTQ